ncbi:MAG: aldo/keto reductase, partial [Candidatus Dormibacteraceae bacterium]
QLAGPGAFGPPADRAAAVAVLREAVDLGVSHFDTADFYGPHVTNQIIKQALHPYPDELHLVTKVGVVRDAQGGFGPALSPGAAGADGLMSARSGSSPCVTLTVVAACLAVFASYLPLTGVAVALTPTGRGLHASTSDLTLVLDFLVLPMAAFALSAGTLGDLIGRRRVLSGGLVLVPIGSGPGVAR